MEALKKSAETNIDHAAQTMDKVKHSAIQGYNSTMQAVHDTAESISKTASQISSKVGQGVHDSGAALGSAVKSVESNVEKVKSAVKHKEEASVTDATAHKPGVEKSVVSSSDKPAPASQPVRPTSAPTPPPSPVSASESTPAPGSTPVHATPPATPEKKTIPPKTAKAAKPEEVVVVVEPAQITADKKSPQQPVAANGPAKTAPKPLAEPVSAKAESPPPPAPIAPIDEVVIPPGSQLLPNLITSLQDLAVQLDSLAHTNPALSLELSTASKNLMGLTSYLDYVEADGVSAVMNALHDQAVKLNDELE
ncbi:hypothetical protein HDU91_004587, partial [Kappamyces sp. JEL0680]